MARMYLSTIPNRRVFFFLAMTILIAYVYYLFRDNSVPPDFNSNINAHETSRKETSEKTGGQVWKGWDKVQYLFVFGDSFTDSQFDIYAHQPEDDSPFGNSMHCKGDDHPNCVPKKWPFFLTQTYNRSLIKTYNFAVGGATIDGDVVEPALDFSTPFKDQVLLKFLKFYHPAPDWASWSPENSLFAVLFGINDILRRAPGRQEVPIEALTKSYKKSVERLYEAGARNFLLLTVPPMDQTEKFDMFSDEQERIEKAKLEKAAIERLNALHGEMCDSLRSTYKDITIFRFNANSLYLDVLEDVARFEQTATIKETTISRQNCDLDDEGKEMKNRLYCDRPEAEFFWSGGSHPAIPVQNATAAMIVEDCFNKSLRPRRYCS